MCLALASYHNASSQSNYFYLRMSSKFKDGAGYSAFGTGPIMDGSLMFVMYPGAKEGGMAPISQRLKPEFIVEEC